MSLGFGLCVNLLGDLPEDDILQDSGHGQRAHDGPQILALQDHKLQVSLAPVVVVLKCTSLISIYFVHELRD